MRLSTGKRRDQEGGRNKKCGVEAVRFGDNAGVVAERESNAKWQRQARGTQVHDECVVIPLCQMRKIEAEPDLEHHEHETEARQYL